MKKVHLACQYFLNYDLQEEELRRQVKALAEAGYQSIYGHARQGLITPYFSKKYWDCIRIIVDECRKNGVNFSIWDEDCFPSGVAGNRIIWNHPELSHKRLCFSVFDLKKGERIYRKLSAQADVLRCFAVGNDRIEDITEHCGTIRGDVSWRQLTHIPYSKVGKIGMPHWRDGWPGRFMVMDYDADFDGKAVAVQVVRYNNSPENSNNTDLLNPETTRLFLELTHEEYLKQCGEENFHNTFDASFLDEPNAGLYCWSTDFAGEFQKQHGFDLLPNLAHIVLDINDKSLFIRHCYRMTQQKMITENYLGQIREWCKKHDIISTGHLSRSESLASSNGFAWPNELKCYSFLDIPCTDPLGAGEAWPDAKAYHTGIKVASSAAIIYNKEQAGADTLAVLGHEASVRDLRFHLDYQMTLGLTYFNIHGLSYSLAGARKDEVPPSIFYQHSQWPWMKDLLSHTRKTCEILNSGSLLCSTAVLYPAATFYCMIRPYEGIGWEEKIHDLTEKLLSNQKDFIFIDEDAICSMMDNDPNETVKKYPFFVIPDLQYLPRTTAEALEKYAACGGKLMVTGKLPLLFGPTLDSGTGYWENGEKFRCANFIELLPGVSITGPGARDILVQQRSIDGKKISFFFNRAEQPFNGFIDGKPAYLAPMQGTLHREGETLSAPDAGVENIRLLDNWQITFPENHLALSGWECPGEFDPNIKEIAMLIQRRIPKIADPNPVFRNSFLFSGECSKVELIVEQDELAHGVKFSINGHEITGFQPANFSDNCFVSADITRWIRSGNSPMLNEIIMLPVKDAPPPEVPYLRGNFKVNFRHAEKSMPFLTGFKGSTTEQILQPWSEYGYGTFSGTIKYRTGIELEKELECQFDLGKVEEVAEVTIDGKVVEVLYTKPYITGKIFLTPGKHVIEIAAANAPGNRDRLAGLPSGMIGPVRLLY